MEELSNSKGSVNSKELSNSKELLNSKGKTATSATSTDLTEIKIMNTTDTIIINKKKNLLQEWKLKCGIQALICYKTSIYYGIMDVLFGVPPIIISSSILIIKRYTVYPYDIIETSLLLSSILMGSIHKYCQYNTLSENFKKLYEKYSELKRKIDIYEAMEFTDIELVEKINEIKKNIDDIKNGSPSAPWIVYRNFDEDKELSDAGKIVSKKEYE